MTSSERNRGLSVSFAAISLVAALVIYVSSRLGIGRTPMRSVEILVVPVLTLAFLFPAYALGALLPSGWGTRLNEVWSNRRLGPVWTALIILGMLAVIWAVFGVVLEAQWGAIEDYETMQWLGSDGEADLSELPSIFSGTEVGGYGTSLRFRPAYYFLRVLETIVWGMNPTAWYACRLAMLALAAILFWRLASSSLGKLGSAMFCLYALSFGYWVDVIGRLGPSETYAVLGLPVYLIGVACASRGRTSRRREKLLACSAIVLGSIICMGSKENFLLLMVPSAVLFVRALQKRDHWLLGAAAAGLLFGLYVGSSLVIALSYSGMDIYDNPISLGHRLGEIVSVLRQRHFITPFSVLVGLAIGVGALRLIPRLSVEARRAIGQAQLWLGALCVVYFTQLVFYGANWPVTIVRYGFPGLLYLPASIAILYGLAKVMLSQAAPESAQSTLKAALIISLLLAIIYHEGYSEVVKGLRQNVAATREFTGRIERIVRVLRQDASKQMVIESGNPQDYEPALMSYPSTLIAYQVRNPLFLRIHGYGPDEVEAGVSQGALRPHQVSIRGGMGYLPLGQLEEQPDRCFSYFLSETYPTSCTPLEYDGAAEPVSPGASETR